MLNLPLLTEKCKKNISEILSAWELFSVPAWLPDHGLGGNPATIYNNPLQPLQKSANLYTNLRDSRANSIKRG
jgi:hypothetical protein